MVKYNKTKKPVFKKMNSKALVVKKRRSNLVSLIKDINIRQSETKYKSINGLIAAAYHDQIVYVNNWVPGGGANNIWPLQGTSDSHRIGDRIVAVGIKYRMAFQIPFDRRNVKCKIWFLPYNSAQGNPTTYNEFFHNISGSSMLDPIQTKRWGGLKFLGSHQLKAMDRDQSGTNTDATMYVSAYMSLNDKKVNFTADSTTDASNMKEQGQILLSFYDTYNTSSVSDIVCTKVNINSTLYFKDL